MKNLFRTVIALLALICLFSAPALADPKGDILEGIAAARAGQFKKAVALFTQAIDSGALSKENLAIAYTNRGSAKDDLGLADDAVADYNLALRADPTYAMAYYNRSYSYQGKGLLRLAIKDMQKAVEIFPNDQDFKSRLKYLLALATKGK